MDTDRDHYYKNGYLIVRNLFSPEECERMRKEADEILNCIEVSHNNLRTEIWEKEGKKLISKIDPVVGISNFFSEISYDERLLKIISHLFGEPGLLFKDKLIYKLPGHPGFGPHQDITWYRKFPEEILAIVVAIDEHLPLSGPLEVAPQSINIDNPVPLSEIRDLYEHEIPDNCFWIPVHMQPGDIMVLSSKVIHKSAPNRTNMSRKTLFLSYSPESYGDLYLKYYNSREKILRKGMGETLGNFNLPSENRSIAEFKPPVTSTSLRNK